MLLDRVGAFLKPFATQTGLVAVSGGPDSVALLRLLVTLQANGKLGRVIVGHLNHRLRGSESAADEAFVHALVHQLQPEATLLSCRSETIAVAERERPRGESLESFARELRYSWLARLAREETATWIATGHTAEDQAETVLFRLLRGTGLQGLCGIPERRPLGSDLTLVRPLLTVRRAEILAYLEAEKQSFRQDASNLDPQFTRNRIRLELLPHLVEHYNPAIVAILWQLAHQAAELHGELDQRAQQLLAEAELPRAGDLLVFDGRRLAACSRSSLRALFRRAWQRERWPQREMTFAHWDRLAAVALGEESAADLPEGLRIRRRGQVIQLGRIEK